MPDNIKSDWATADEKEKWIMAPLWSFWNYVCAHCIGPPGSHDDNGAYLSAGNQVDSYQLCTGGIRHVINQNII